VVSVVRRVALALLCCLSLVGVSACEGAEPGASSSGSTSGRATPSAVATSSGTTAPSSENAAVRPGSALAALARLAVKGRAPKTGYDRDVFGQAWADVDRNGCDTRNDILRRDLTSFVLKAGTRGCLVLSGTLNDPYTGATIPFVRGQQTSMAVQIDHVVALSDAWQKGAQGWDAAKRERFANDPLNLLAVDGPSNSRKGDGDAATWLPPAKGYRCRYVARQVAVKAAYGVWVTRAEKAAIARILASCPGQPLPAAAARR
jgi:integrase